MLHELHERNLMPEGHEFKIKNNIIEADANYNKIYTSAHIKASKLEYFCRHHPEKLDKKLKQEIEKIDPAPILLEIYFTKCTPRIVEYFMSEALRLLICR